MYAELNLNGFSQTLAGLTSAGTAVDDLVIGGGTLTLGNNTTNTSFSGVISGSTALTKTGATTQESGGGQYLYRQYHGEPGVTVDRQRRELEFEYRPWCSGAARSVSRRRPRRP